MSDTQQGADPHDDLRERVAPRGSTLYYCTLFVPAPQARRSIALEALKAELDDVIEECREPAVAAARLGWWHEELRRFADGNAQHPATRALADVLAARQGAAERLATAVASTAAASALQSWPDEDALQRYCMDTGGEFAVVECAAAGDEERVRAVGALICAHDMLARLCHRPRHGCQVFPAPRLAAAGVTPADLFAVPTPAAADQLVRACADDLRRRLATALAGWRPRDAASRVLMARALVAMATLRAIGRGGAVWLARHTAVSPLRKLWIGWRITRRIDTRPPPDPTDRRS